VVQLGGRRDVVGGRHRGHVRRRLVVVVVRLLVVVLAPAGLLVRAPPVLR
jgi:hypothetical protein